jgi:hypothetical protein
MVIGFDRKAGCPSNHSVSGSRAGSRGSHLRITLNRGRLSRPFEGSQPAYFVAGESGPAATRNTELREESFPPDLEFALTHSPPHQIRDDGTLVLITECFL